MVTRTINTGWRSYHS